MASDNVKNFELKLGKTGVVIVIVGVTALLCCTFLFGIAVGKNIDSYPEKIASLPQRLLALVWRPAKMKVAQSTSVNRAGQDQTPKAEDVDLTFYNTLTSKKGVAKEQPIPDKKTAMEKPAAPSLLQQSRNETGLVPVVPNPEVKNKQIPPGPAETSGDEIEAKIKEAETAVAGTKKYSIQVASLKDKTKADAMGKKLSLMGYAPRIVENSVPGKGKWFRVVIDGFAGKNQAQAAAEKISGKTGASCIVRRMDTASN